MTESKKAWVTPELIVLVRNNPEEAVLVACKWDIVGNPASGRGTCSTLAPGPSDCMDCTSLAAS
jgi:hypothetical protein